MRTYVVSESRAVADTADKEKERRDRGGKTENKHHHNLVI